MNNMPWFTGSLTRLDSPQTRALGVVANATASEWLFMEIVAAGNSSGQAKAFTDKRIAIKRNAIKIPLVLMMKKMWIDGGDICKIRKKVEWYTKKSYPFLHQIAGWFHFYRKTVWGHWWMLNRTEANVSAKTGSDLFIMGLSLDNRRYPVLQSLIPEFFAIENE